LDREDYVMSFVDSRWSYRCVGVRYREDRSLDPNGRKWPDPACRNELPALTAGPIGPERAAPKQAQHLI